MGKKEKNKPSLKMYFQRIKTIHAFLSRNFFKKGGNNTEKKNGKTNPSKLYKTARILKQPGHSDSHYRIRKQNKRYNSAPSSNMSGTLLIGKKRKTTIPKIF